MDVSVHSCDYQYFSSRYRSVYSVIIATDFTLQKLARQKLIESEQELKKRVSELEKFYEMSIGREMKMKELKKEIKRLNDELAHCRQKMT
ncbi:MAG: hypothetical protein HY754_08275 [Nitrospirae bacterium]|nr:hypothetical protein [Nitrospirota bacterium]